VRPRDFSAAVLCVTLAIATLALSAPSIRLGGRVTSVNGTFSAGWDDSLGEVSRITYVDAYKGMGIEAIYGPVGWVYGRAELAGVRFFNAGGGALVVFPAAGLDVLVEPQLHWRVLPYVWGGGSYAGYWGKQDNADPRFWPSGKLNSLYELRAGIGVEYRLSRRVNLFAETQTLVYLSVLAPSAVRGFPQQWRLDGYGPMARADLGFRYDFGAK
jgi:hypothetical protein